MIAIYDVINTVFFVFLVHLFIGVFVREKRLVSYRKGLTLALWIILEIIVVNIFSKENTLFNTVSSIEVKLLPSSKEPVKSIPSI